MIEIEVTKAPNNLDAINDICFSKYFKRLADKTQMIETRVSEHYRTRLTHTLEVMSIANTICDKINNIFVNKNIDIEIDKNIVLATALAHDLGHTPYGHEGEKTIKELLKETDHLFKHNINSIKIMLEEKKQGNRKPLEIFPENIDWQIIDGVLKHTKVYPDGYIKKNADPYDLNIYFQNHPVYADESFKSYINSFIGSSSTDFIETYLEYPYPLTLSGQIVAIADEIAQRISDFDDAIRILKKRNIRRIAATVIYKNLVSRINDVKNYLHSIDDSKKTKTYNSTINYCEHILKLLNEAKKYDELSFINIVNRTKNFYIENLIENIENNLSLITMYNTLIINYKEKKIDMINKTVNYFLIPSTGTYPFIYFDEFVEKIRKTMSDFSYSKVHNSKEVVEGNSKGNRYIKKWYNCCISDFNLCDNKVKHRLIKLYSDTFNIENCEIGDAFSEFQKDKNKIYIDKCKLIILEGISYMTNNYLCRKITDNSKNK